MAEKKSFDITPIILLAGLGVGGYLFGKNSLKRRKKE